MGKTKAEGRTRLLSRREFLWACGVGLGAGVLAVTLGGKSAPVLACRNLAGPLPPGFAGRSAAGQAGALEEDAGQTTPAESGEETLAADDATLRDYLYKMQHFDEPHPQDIYLTAAQMPLFVSLQTKLEALQRHVGHLNFQVLSLDEGRLQAKRMKGGEGGFTAAELSFLEELFYADAGRYGFLDQKPFSSMTYAIPAREVVKVPYMGNYIYRGAAEKTWREIHKLLGDEVLLTSGVRSVLKQFLLFLNKAARNNGNLSLASRSLAPPGYSFHGVGDFDVGKRGLAEKNFTEAFTRTSVFQTLNERGYLTLRYPQGNLLGVRFEPWHVRVVEQSQA